MADLKNIQRFVALVDERNTRYDHGKDVLLTDLIDESVHAGLALVGEDSDNFKYSYQAAVLK